MDDFQQYPPGLLSALGINPEDLRRQQQQAGLLSAGLQLLAGSGYSPVRQTTGQLLGQAGMAGVQGMQQAGESAIDRALKGLQVSEFSRRQQEAQQLRSLLPQVFQVTRTPEKREVFPTETGDYERVTPGGVSNVRIDPAKLQALMMIPGGAEAVRGLAETQKLVRQAGLGIGGAEMTSPFTPYMAAQNPEVRRLADVYEKGLKAGTITEEEAYKRIESLGRLEDSFVARAEAAKDRELARDVARQDRLAQREERESVIPEKLQSQIQGIDLAAKSLTDLKKEVEQKGVAYLKRDTTFAELKTAYQKALFNLKDLYALGALQIGDVEQINYLLQDPTSLSGYYLGKEGVLASIESVENLVKDRAESLKRVAPQRFQSKVQIPSFPTIKDIRDQYKLEGTR